MNLASGLVSLGRRQAEALMLSTVRIRRKTGQTFSSATGNYTPTWATIYEGPARVRFTQADPTEIDGAGQRLAEQSPIVALPIAAHSAIVSGSSAAVRVDDEGSVLTNPDDPGIVGLTFRVAGQHAQTHSTARRLPVEVVAHG